MFAGLLFSFGDSHMAEVLKKGRPISHSMFHPSPPALEETIPVSKFFHTGFVKLSLLAVLKDSFDKATFPAHYVSLSSALRVWFMLLKHRKD